ncbi:CDP-alcohol phosphatidyltransferase family protein [Candidatus Woesearchaeota archaeon]|jgi:hypothetical protein|nr:CDP-alcohol phosphatidyltransferase family protein [Candidatus Woesearchaeota archaeon]MBT4368849.1 CDP-alcohol phosphatidyltransferase family protein [Candidatus Woesearchaeota archaeon]MBT4712138.1 CDP-alcohol phosphatidyltransferase family protein [Candidatus Woesearchaeota archaeon]MBT6639114.1 CDP-alcohol phosphatidyltransferase family protein [Candidatus Woesearchaeota archaeon]MBT7134314.1 CDP-alcohol phosphatidyltransferase family protein [Candidatus Woesearchaeota archaeon]
MRISFKEVIEKGFSRNEELNKGNTKLNFTKIQHTVLRCCGVVIAKLLLYTPITANQVTVLGTIVLFLSAGLFSAGTFWYSLTAIILLFVAECIDYADGVVARCRKTSTRIQSMYLALLYHHSEFTLHYLGIGVGVFINTGNPIYILAGGITAFFTMMAGMASTLKKAALFKANYEKEKVTEHKKKKFSMFKLGMLVLNIPRKWVFVILIIAFTINRLDIFVLFYAVYEPLRVIAYMTKNHLLLKKIEEKINQ